MGLPDWAERELAGVLLILILFSVYQIVQLLFTLPIGTISLVGIGTVLLALLYAYQSRILDRQTRLIQRQTEMMEYQVSSQLDVDEITRVYEDRIFIRISNTGEGILAGLALHTQCRFDNDRYRAAGTRQYSVLRGDDGDSFLEPGESGVLDSEVHVHYFDTENDIMTTRRFSEAVDSLRRSGTDQIEFQVYVVGHDQISERREHREQIWDGVIDLQEDMMFEDPFNGDGLVGRYGNREPFFD